MHNAEKNGKQDKRAVVEKFFDMIYKLALSQTKDRDSADDVVQEVFLRFLKSDKDFEAELFIMEN